MLRNIGPGEIIVIVVVLTLVFGASKLPELARSIGASAKEFRKGLEEGSRDSESEDEETPA